MSESRDEFGTTSVTAPVGAGAVDAPVGAGAVDARANPQNSVAGSDGRPASGVASASRRGYAGDGRFIPAGANTPGVTDTTIQIGFLVADAAAKAATVNAVFGDASSVSGGSGVAAAKALAAYLNGRGGIAGRKIVPVYSEDQPRINNAARQQNNQTACSTFTEDNHVFALQLAWGDDLTLLECAARKRTVAFTASFGFTLSESMFAKKYRDIFYAPAWILSDRRERILVDGLARQGFFGSDAKVGILIEDTQAAREGVRQGMLPALSRHGIKPAIQILYPDPIESPWSTYVLQLQQAGVNRVLFSAMNSGGHGPGYFTMQAASNQRYYPRWGLASDFTPTMMEDFGAPREQLARTQGVGWDHRLDLGTSNKQPAQLLCDKILRDANQPPESFQSYCEILFFLKFALDRASEVSPAGLSEALRRVGTGYESVFTVGGATSFAPDRHDGVSTVRDFAYNEPCGRAGGAHCFRYTSPPIAVK